MSRRSRNALLWTLLGAALLAWGWFDVRRRGRIDPANPAAHKTDFTIYTEAGAAFFDGRDPYAVKNIRGWEYLYPPFFALIVSPLHALQPQDQVFIWFLISAMAGVAAVWECRRISLAVWADGEGEAPAESRPPPGWIGPLVLLAGLLPLLNTLQRGQVGAVVLWALLAGFRWAVLSRRGVLQILGGTLLALPIVIKLTPALIIATVLLYLLLARPIVRFACVASGVGLGLVVGILALPAAMIGWDATVLHTERWWTAVATNPNLAADTRLVLDSVRNQSLTNSLRLAFGGDQAWMPAVTWVLLALVGVLLFIVVARRARQPDGGPRSAAAAFGLAGVASLLLSPVSWGHHYFLMMPASAFVAIWALRARLPVAALILGILPAMLVVAHYAFLDTLGPLGVLGLGTFFWYFVAAVVLAAPSGALEAVRKKNPNPTWRRPVTWS